MTAIDAAYPPTDETGRDVLAGDWTDDDGQAIDDQFTPVYYGPVVSESAEYEKEALPTATRLLSTRVPVGTINGALADPVQVFPADPNRKSLRIILSGTCTITVGSEKSDSYYGAELSSTNSFDNVTTVAVPTEYVFDGHTGPLWIYSTYGAPVYVNVIAVTS